ncbi:MAG: class I SAM-dependent methyltransferase [Candidatus ainarchaeum sp.]|nr:class I SAM-dependent methyltransferase [Candidatus ainarchaeum sp.]
MVVVLDENKCVEIIDFEKKRKTHLDLNAYEIASEYHHLFEPNPKDLFPDVEGWLTTKEGLFLYELSKKVGSGCIVEIGSWFGKSTCWIAQGLKENNKKNNFYAIDPHIGSNEHKKFVKKVGGTTNEIFLHNLCGHHLEKYVIPIKKMSWEAINDIKEPIAFLFIDGSHEYEDVKKDFEQWFSKVKIGGIIAFHDNNWVGVKKVLDEIDRNDYSEMGIIETITWIKK